MVLLKIQQKVRERIERSEKYDEIWRSEQRGGQHCCELVELVVELVFI